MIPITFTKAYHHSTDSSTNQTKSKNKVTNFTKSENLEIEFEKLQIDQVYHWSPIVLLS